MDINERIDLIRSDRWIAFDRATIVLNRLISLMEMPRQSRMPGLMVYGSSGIGKTMVAKRMESLYPSQYASEIGVTRTPILLLQAPPAPDERRFYQHILASIGAPMWGRHTVSELELRALSHLRDMDLKMIMIDEVHNLLAGSYREQRRFLNMLRFLANDLCVALVVFGVNEAVDAIRGDEQLARTFRGHIRLQQYARLEQPIRRATTSADDTFQLLALFSIQTNNILHSGSTFAHFSLLRKFSQSDSENLNAVKSRDTRD